MKKRTLILMLLFPLISAADIPPGYYDSAEGLTGEELQWALHYIIDNHTVKSYDYLWIAFYTTDDRDGDKVWDMYSDIPGGTPPYLYTLGDDQGGSASGEGEGYNREHTWPKSWFGGTVSPMYTDLFHVVPTDIYVNNRRSNYPYSEVDNPIWTSMNCSRLGPSVTPGYSGVAFEPRDEFKGDLARNFFYMATRYKGEDGSWPGSVMADGADLKDWAVDMLMDWHLNDPVSAKELDRIEAVYTIQDNRNPFIDHPEYVQCIYDPASGVPEEIEPAVLCFRNAPNPFTFTTTVSYCLASEGLVSLRIYSTSGHLVTTLQDDFPVMAGMQQIVWSGTDDHGRSIVPGIYFAVLSTSADISTMRMVFIDR